jgi:hypothetical protein
MPVSRFDDMIVSCEVVARVFFEAENFYFEPVVPVFERRSW